MHSILRNISVIGIGNGDYSRHSNSGIRDIISGHHSGYQAYSDSVDKGSTTENTTIFKNSKERLWGGILTGVDIDIRMEKELQCQIVS